MIDDSFVWELRGFTVWRSMTGVFNIRVFRK